MYIVVVHCGFALALIFMAGCTMTFQLKLWQASGHIRVSRQFAWRWSVCISYSLLLSCSRQQMAVQRARCVSGALVKVRHGKSHVCRRCHRQRRLSDWPFAPGWENIASVALCSASSEIVFDLKLSNTIYLFSGRYESPVTTKLHRVVQWRCCLKGLCYICVITS